MEEVKERPLKRLQRIVRYVMKHKDFSDSILSSYDKAAEKMERVKSMGSQEFVERPYFEVSYFDVRDDPIPGVLSQYVRRALTHLPHERTKAQLASIHEEFETFDFFKSFNFATLAKMARSLQLCAYREGSIIIKEGHVPWSLYLVISGTISVNITNNDPETNKPVLESIGSVTPGYTFGDEVVQGIRRQHTMKCETNVQVLKLDDEDLDPVRELVKKRVNLLHGAFTEIPGLSSVPWKGNTLQTLKYECLVQRYEKDTLIMDGNTDSPWAYFVLDGNCGVCRIFKYTIEIESNGAQHYIPVDESTIETDEEGPHVFKKMLDICTLKRGHYFCVGEVTKNRFYFSKDEVYCLLIRRLRFMEAKKGLLSTMQQSLIDNFVTDEQILHTYLEYVRWMDFRKQEFTALMASVPPKCSFGTRKKGEKPPFFKYF